MEKAVGHVFQDRILLATGPDPQLPRLRDRPGGPRGQRASWNSWAIRSSGSSPPSSSWSAFPETERGRAVEAQGLGDEHAGPGPAGPARSSSTRPSVSAGAKRRAAAGRRSPSWPGRSRP
ncbi:MAG: hypothetical protein MZU95_01885 [Desulfomicrobium escambiense]|nr:hypothetical protein [Desulfomicrobium escambiense]